ncbi:MAG TPA: S8 family peptidase [Actinomycetota bacterium]|nr:S8 family peptidase [Actinomycetota bacterium]
MRVMGLRAAGPVTFAVLAALLIAPTFALSRPAGPSPSIDVIVRADSADEARRLVEASGGTVTRSLPIVNGVAASVPVGDLAEVTEAGATVVRDAPISLTGSLSARAVKNAAGARVPRIVRSKKLWREGITGKGVTVAILDTGVYSAHLDLQGKSQPRVVHCEDFSGEFADGDPAPIDLDGCSDPFGHGTFMAGLVAGDGTSSGGRFKGAAPRARLVSVKAAGYDGSTDISKILAGIQWVVAHKDVYDIRVLNLSLGSDSSQDYRTSPLNYAVERAWDEGIVVVVSAGNSGSEPGTVMKPGDDPFVITVGSSNDEGTLRIRDDRVPVFSSRGRTRSNDLVKPDIVSPGVHTVSLASPGSAIDEKYGGRARVGNGYFRGSGTSMSTATVSGIVAQMLQRSPGLTPDQVKHRLLAKARRIRTTRVRAVGQGLVDAFAATMSDSTKEANRGLEMSDGSGSLEADRGSVEVFAGTPAGNAAIDGEFVAQSASPEDPLTLVPWVGLTYQTTGWDPASWDQTTWSTEEWTATSWKATSWKVTTWDGTHWDGTSWKNQDWSATSWKNVDWDATSWKATSWKSAWYAAAWD